MRCHHCDREAAFAAETGGVRVGLCDSHFREQFAELADADVSEELRERLELDRL